MEKTNLDYEAEIFNLKQENLKMITKYEDQLKELNQIINEMKHTYYKIPDYEDGPATDFYTDFY